MLQYLIPFFFFTLFTAFFVLLFKVRFGEALPLAICAPAFLLYFSQYVLHTYFIGFCLLLLLAFIAIPLFLVHNKKDTADRNILKHIFSPGFISFTTIYFFAIFLLTGKSYCDWDEMTHWGMMIKEALRLDDFYAIEASRVIWHKEYPPFSCMLEVFWAMLGGLSEDKMTIAMHVSTLSLVLPWLTEQISDRKKSPRWYHIIILSLSLEALILMLEYSLDVWSPRITSSILPDIFLSFLCVQACALIYTRAVKQRFFFATLCLISTTLVMTKQVGLAFYLLVLFLFCAYELKEHSGKLWILKAILLASIPLLLLKSWNHFSSQYQNGSQFDLSKIKFSEYLAAIHGQSSDIRNSTFRMFYLAMFQAPANNVTMLPITFASALVICLLLLFALHRFFPNLIKASDFRILVLLNILGAVGYAFMLSVLYLFCFPEGEMAGLAGLFRYMASYLMWSFTFILILALLALFTEKKTFIPHKHLLLMAALSLVLLNPNNIYHFTPQRTAENVYASYKPYADYLSSKVEKNSTVYIIYDKTHTTNPDWWGPMHYFVQYYADQLTIMGNYQYSYGFDEDYSNPKKLETLMTRLSSCDYLYMIDTNDNINQYLSPYNQGQPFVNMGIYHVYKTENGIQFSLVP